MQKQDKIPELLVLLHVFGIGAAKVQVARAVAMDGVAAFAYDLVATVDGTDAVLRARDANKVAV